MPRIHQERAHAFLRERNGATFSIPEMARATGWSESTVKTYVPKHWRPWLTRVGAGTYRVAGFDRVSLDVFMRRQSQVKSDSPDELQDDAAAPDSDFLSDAAWSELTRNLRDDAAAISETRTLLRRIQDDPASSPEMVRIADTADFLLDIVADYIKTGNASDEPHARVSATWLRSQGVKVLRASREYAPTVVEVARRLVDMIGGL